MRRRVPCTGAVALVVAGLLASPAGRASVDIILPPISAAPAPAGQLDVGAMLQPGLFDQRPSEPALLVAPQAAWEVGAGLAVRARPGLWLGQDDASGWVNADLRWRVPLRSDPWHVALTVQASPYFAPVPTPGVAVARRGERWTWSLQVPTIAVDSVCDDGGDARCRTDIAPWGLLSTTLHTEVRTWDHGAVLAGGGFGRLFAGVSHRMGPVGVGLQAFRATLDYHVGAQVVVDVRLVERWKGGD